MVLIASAEELPAMSFFGDASSKEKDFMVAGGFAVAGSRIAEIEAQINDIADRADMRGEFHWSAYGGGKKRAAYEELVEYAFDLTRKRHAALHVIIAKFHGYAHKANKGENRDTSVNRMYYQLCLHRLARFYGAKRTIHIRLDEGNDSEDICKMRGAVCAGAYYEYGTKPNCIRSLEPMGSEHSRIIQMADVILGGIAAKRNGVVHSGAKGPLADHILAQSGRPNWHTETPMSARFLTVWNHKGKGSGPS
jgi:hypothetical protein